MSLGIRIASMRGYRRLTQEELGNMVGVSKQTMSGWERNTAKPNANYLRELCKALGCSPQAQPCETCGWGCWTPPWSCGGSARHEKRPATRAG